MRESLTKNFYRDEFACKGKNCCGHSAPIDLTHVNILETFRCLLDIPLHVNSGFRCLIYNRSIGSNDNSQHPKGVAADIKIPENINIELMLTIAIELFGGVGIYDTFFHLDNGPRRKHWDERSRSS